MAVNYSPPISGSDMMAPPTEVGLDLEISTPAGDVVIERQVLIIFAWTRPVNGFTEDAPSVRSFGPGGAELEDGNNRIAYLSHFDGNDGDRVYSATLNLPPSALGQIEIFVGPQVAQLSTDETVTGPPAPRTLTIEYNTRRMVQAPGVSIVTPNGKDTNLVFNWTEPVGGFIATDVMLPNGSPISLIPETFEQLDFEGARYQIQAMLPPNAQGSVEVTVPMGAAQGEHGRGPAADETETWTYDTRSQNRTITGATTVATLTKTLSTLVDGMFAGVLETIAHDGFVYIVAQVLRSRQSTPNNFVNLDEQAGAELWRVRISDGQQRLIKSWSYVTIAARSLCVHDGAVHFFEGSHLAYQLNDRVETDVVYDQDQDKNVRVRSYRWKENIGQLYKIVGNAAVEVGQTFRSAFVNPDTEEAPRDTHYGVHGGMASPMRSTSDGLHLISGYGDLRNINDSDDPVADVDNWQLLTLKEQIEPRLPVLETNGRTGWALLEAVAATFGSAIGFTPEGNFFMKPAEPPGAEITSALSATGTSISLDNFNTLEVPLGGRCLIGEELMSFTRSGTTLTLTRTNGVAHNANSPIIFVDHVIRLDSSVFVDQDLEDILFTQAEAWFFNAIDVKYGINVYPARDEASITEHGESKLEVSTLYNSQQRAMATALGERYLKRFSQYREQVTLQLHPEFDISETDVVYLDIPGRAYANVACQVAEVNHQITDQMSEITLITI